MQNNNLPPVMDSNHPLAKFVSAEDAKNIQKATGGDSKQMKRTSIAVFQEGLGEVESQLRATGFQVEYVKLGSFRMHYRADIADLIAMCQQHNVQPHLGGQMVEFAITNGLSSRQIADSLSSMNLTTVEVSNSGKKISDKVVDRLTRDLAKDFTVIREVGDKTHSENTLKSMEDDLKRALDSDAHRVVIEGGGSGDSFVYNRSKRIKTLLLPRLLAITDEVDQGDRVMVETPHEHQRGYMLTNNGWRSRLANVPVNGLQETFEERVTATDPQRQRKIDATQTKFRELLLEIITHCSQCDEHNVDTLFNSDMGGFEPTDLNHISQMRDAIINHRQVGQGHVSMAEVFRILMG